jgi:hypothetical protein
MLYQASKRGYTTDISATCGFVADINDVDLSTVYANFKSAADQKTK